VRFTFSCPVRWDDMDAFGHVNNVTFLTYMQEARTAMLFAGEAAHRAPDLLKGVVVSRHEIDYRRPLEWRPEPIEVQVWISELKAASFTLRYQVLDPLTPHSDAPAAPAAPAAPGASGASGASGAEAALSGVAVPGSAVGAPLLLADAMTVLVPFDLAAGRPRRLSDGERAFFTSYLE
jgi:acyl-CoA thioester hydrolase